MNNQNLQSNNFINTGISGALSGTFSGNGNTGASHMTSGNTVMTQDVPNILKSSFSNHITTNKDSKTKVFEHNEILEEASMSSLKKPMNLLRTSQTLKDRISGASVLSSPSTTSKQLNLNFRLFSFIFNCTF